MQGIVCPRWVGPFGPQTLEIKPITKYHQQTFPAFYTRNICWLIYLAVLFLLWIHAPSACMNYLYDTSGGVKAQWLLLLIVVRGLLLHHQVDVLLMLSSCPLGEESDAPRCVLLADLAALSCLDRWW